jgi:chromosomal replication initiator protein
MQDCSAVPGAHQLDDLASANALLEASPPTFNEIATSVCLRYRVAFRQVAGHRHFPDITKPRHVLIYLARTLTKLSLAQIASRLGNRNITTIREAELSVAHRIEGNEHFRDEIDFLRIEIAERVLCR